MNPGTLVRYIEAHFKAPPTGGRYTNHAWGAAKLVWFSKETQVRLQRLAAYLGNQVGHKVYPMQVAAVLIELALEPEKTDDRQK